MIVLSIDPGISIGYCLADTLSDRHYNIFNKGVVKGYAGINFLLNLSPTPELVIIEDFTLWPATCQQVSKNDPKLLTCRYIGALDFEFKKLGIPVKYQQPSMKTSCPNDLLKKLGLWYTNTTAHEKDAIRHIVVYQRINNHAKSKAIRR